MSNAAKLKNKAAEFEQKKQFDKALQTYLEAIEAASRAGEEADVGLCNRVGDLYMRDNHVGEAMKYYDRAVDLYAEGGFYNNAIALCNKILRLSPGRNSVYYKLGRISARKGFVNDAKQNFLEYAHRMQTAGQLDEAFRALKEFAELVPGQEDFRLKLAEQLTKQGRTAEAVEQLHRLYEKYQSEGRSGDMRAAADKMKQVGAAERKTPARARHTPELVFLDLGDSAPARGPGAPSAGPSGAASELPAAPNAAQENTPPDDRRELPFIAVGGDVPDVSVEPAAGASPGAAPMPEGTATETSGPAVEPLDSEAFAKLRLPTPLDLPSIEALAHDLVIPGALPPVDRMPADKARPAASGAHAGRPMSLTPEMTVLIPDDARPPGAPRPTRPTAPRAVAPARPTPRDSPIEELSSGQWQARRKQAEAMFEAGDRERGIRELDTVMLGLERARDLSGARAVVEELLRINPNSVRHHQKRVEYAVRADETAALPEVYLKLGDALVRDGQLDAARAVYRRVLELAPDEPRAVVALSTFGEAPTRDGGRGGNRRTSGSQPDAAAATSDFVNLGDWLRDESGPKSTRMVAPDQRPTGDEAADFASMLRSFKAAVAQNVELDDSDSHFDLGVAYKEMGLLDEAIAEFQRALMGPGRRARTCEALGQCFLEKRQPAVASTILLRALQEPRATEEQLVGILYLLGYAAEGQQRPDDAIGYYQRVCAVDIEFRDAARRLTALEQQVTR